MRFVHVWGVVLVSIVALQLTAARPDRNGQQRNAKPWERGPKPKRREHPLRPHPRHAEPDPHKLQRKFRGGHVRHPLFEGQGCPNGSVALVNSSDTTSFALSALFSEFQAQTSVETLRDTRTCVITVALEPEENMSIRVTQVDFRGSAYVPVSTAIAADAGVVNTSPRKRPYARLRASYDITSVALDNATNSSTTFVAGYATNGTTFVAGYDDEFYMAVSVSDVTWTPCETETASRARAFEFRILVTVTAAKANASDEDVAIAVDTSDAALQKGVYYELTARPCRGGAAQV